MDTKSKTWNDTVYNQFKLIFVTVFVSSNNDLHSDDSFGTSRFLWSITLQHV